MAPPKRRAAAAAGITVYMVRLRCVLVTAVVLASATASPAQAKPWISSTEVEADMEITYVFDVPAPVMDATIAAGNGSRYAIEAECSRPRKREQRWDCLLLYYTEPPGDDQVTCNVDGRAWMTRKGLKTWRGRVETCDD